MGVTSSRQAASVTITSALSDQNEPSLSSAMATIFCVVGEPDAGRDAGAAGAGPEMDAHHVGLRVLLVEDVDGLDVVGRRHRAVDRDRHRHHVAVLDQRRDVERHLARAHDGFADRVADGLGGRGRDVRQGRPRRPGDGKRGNARAPRDGQGDLPAAPAARWVSGRASVSLSSPAASQESYHVLDLLGRQHRLAAPGRRDPRQPFDPVEGRHDRVGIEPARIDDAQPQLPFGPARARRP